VTYKLIGNEGDVLTGVGDVISPAELERRQRGEMTPLLRAALEKRGVSVPESDEDPSQH
jgi:hypothetical protein